MLKVIKFGGVLVADIDRFHKYSIENVVQEAIDDHRTELKCTVHTVIKPSDIPCGWETCIPYGDRKDDKTCIQIFEEEILPNQPTEDPNQNKFEFFKG